MKKTIINLISKWQILLLLLLSIPVMAEKPKIQVSFDIHTNSSLNSFFSNDINTMEEQALCTLMSGLNDYIGFLGFGSETSSLKLEITLNDINQGIIPEYWLYFRLSEADDTENFEHEWKFIDIEEESYTFKVESIMSKLKEDWVAYLKSSANQDLVTKLFGNIGFSLPNSEHYYTVENVKQVFLPFKKSALMINHIESLFEIKTIILDSRGAPSILQRTGNGIGEVKEEMTTNSDLWGCIRIELKEFEGLQPEKGQIFIKLYKRKLPDITATADDFFESNQECHE